MNKLGSEVYTSTAWSSIPKSDSLALPACLHGCCLCSGCCRCRSCCRSYWLDPVPLLLSLLLLLCLRNVQDFTVLAALLQQNPHLSVLDLGGNSCMPDRLLHAAVLAASCRHLKTLDLSGCELVRPGAYVPDAFPSLVCLDVSNTATTDADVQVLAEGLPLLQSLSIAGCRRVSEAVMSSSCEGLSSGEAGP